MSSISNNHSTEIYYGIYKKKEDEEFRASFRKYSITVNFKASNKLEWLAFPLILGLGRQLRDGETFSCEGTTSIGVGLYISKTNDSQCYFLEYEKIIKMGTTVIDNIIIEVDETDPKSSRVYEK